VLIRVDADVFVEDVSHRNGLFLNQVRVHRTRLLDGDLLQVGDVVLRFERG
jgi:pSer/pThr/pTyr-binding forkhead associated (FHA) protein